MADSRINDFQLTIAGIADASQATTATVANTTQASQVLARLSTELQEQVRRFTI